MATLSGIVTDDTGRQVVPATVRADGSTRKERKVRPGFIPEDDRSVYVVPGRRGNQEKPTRRTLASLAGEEDSLVKSFSALSVSGTSREGKEGSVSTRSSPRGSVILAEGTGATQHAKPPAAPPTSTLRVSALEFRPGRSTVQATPEPPKPSSKAAQASQVTQASPNAQTIASIADCADNPNSHPSPSAHLLHSNAQLNNETPSPTPSPTPSAQIKTPPTIIAKGRGFNPGKAKEENPRQVTSSPHPDGVSILSWKDKLEARKRAEASAGAARKTEDARNAALVWSKDRHQTPWRRK